ncbi:MAG: hypothetical protein HGA65_05010 [Oscillochloris sp.]|nr:hypothetical protein [Oscillochloris sp.]
MFYYTAYGLEIESNQLFPELTPVEAGLADVAIRVERTAEIPSYERAQRNMKERYVYGTEEVLFEVDGGTRIRVTAQPSVTERFIQQAILGAIMGVLLYQRGHLVLHASAVVVKGRAVIFLGEKGQGKSTTAAAFVARGYPILTDDVVVLDFRRAGVPYILPGVPQLRLWPDSVASSLGADPADLPEIVAGMEKRISSTHKHFANQAYPVDRAYILLPGPAIAISPLGRQEALIESIRHTFVNNLLDRHSMGIHLQQCAQFVRDIPVFTLSRPHDFSLLPEMVQRIVDSRIDPSSVEQSR